MLPVLLALSGDLLLVQLSGGTVHLEGPVLLGHVDELTYGDDPCLLSAAESATTLVVLLLVLAEIVPVELLRG